MSGSLIERIGAFFTPQSNAQEEAMKILGDIGFPGKKSEAYKYTPITSIFENAELSEKESTASLEPFYNAEGNHLVIRNGKISGDESKMIGDITIESSAITAGKYDPFSLLNTALSPEEVVIKVAKSNETVIFLYTYSDGFVNDRIKVEAEEGANLTIIEKPFLVDQSFVNSFRQISVAKNAFVNYTIIQNFGTAINHTTLVVDQDRDSRFTSNCFSFSGQLIRNNITINLQDENCEGNMYGLYLLDGKSHVDINTSVDHLKPNSLSNELYKGILDEKSKGVFNGKIFVRQDAQKTNAFQANNNILLSDDSVVHTKPQLEIWADDVKCSHGCTTGQLDEEAIFYLRSRGISERQAKAMILKAFAAETLTGVTLEEIREELNILIDKQLT